MPVCGEAMPYAGGMLVSGRELLAWAVERRCAAGSFNTYNIEITRAIIGAAEAKGLPVFLAIGAGALDYAGFGVLTEASLQAAREAAVPVAVHLDHAPDVATLARCAGAGFTSLMIDGHRLPFVSNVSLCQAAVEASGGVAVEAELGGVPGTEDASGAHVHDIPMTDPGEAARFVAETGVESLAIAIGNAHGVYAGEPHLDFERLAALRDAVSVPLVLHGASGIADGDIRRCIDMGIRKINVNTEIRQAMFESLGASLGSVGGYDVTKLLGGAVQAMQAVVAEKLEVFSGGAS
jgi:fructose-bisphosphate aldolase class II